MQAVLILEDGSVFHGKPIGVTGQTIGEVVFNTSMTGYQEILTDPSYKEQIVTLTTSHVGNTGINPFDEESSQLHLKGLIIKELAEIYSDYRASESLSEYLIKHHIVGIHDIDTRKLTHILRDKGAQKGGILCQDIITAAMIDDFLKTIKASKGLEGQDLAKEVTCKEIYTYVMDGHSSENSDVLDANNGKAPAAYTVVVYDFGVKKNILNLLVEKGCKVIVVPANTLASDVLALNPDGVLLSNGPGDPAACDYAIASTKILLEKALPLMGICLGHQILALASGAKTIKMKFGHHGANHPVKNLLDDTVAISVQNHGFTVDTDTLPSHIDITHVSLFDGSIQGIKHKHTPAFGFQGHPEASPGPSELSSLFDLFIHQIKSNQTQSKNRLL